ALQETGNSEARHLLIKVAKQPGAEGSFQDRQQTVDERLTAIRALAKFNQGDSTQALIYVLETEKDVALRDAAKESLQTLTGKTLPAQAWQDRLDTRPTQQATREPNFIQRVFGRSEDNQVRQPIYQQPAPQTIQPTPGETIIEVRPQ